MLRYAEPIHWSEILKAWVITPYDDVQACFKNPLLSNALRRAAGTANLPIELQEKMKPIDRYLSLWVLNLDGKEHHRLRVLLSKAFTPQIFNDMEPRILAIANELIDAVEGKGEMDFAAQFARPLPIGVIAEMFGVPMEDRKLLNHWSIDISTFFAIGPAKVEVLDNMLRSLEEMTEYLRGVVNANRSNPKDNLLGMLIRAEEEGDVLNEDQLLATCVLLLFAGHDSTVNLIGTGLLALIQNHDQLALLRKHPSLIKTAVQEFLRYESPVMRHDRVASEDFELHGHQIRAGQRVILIVGAANRDPDVFRNPDQLDITRQEKHSLAFGDGPHSCLGYALACKQAEIGINLVLERLPNIRAGVRPHVWRQHFNFRGLQTFPVEF
jgi:cytochrome P450